MKHNNKIRPYSGLFFGWTAVFLSAALLSSLLLSGCRAADGGQGFAPETAPAETGRNQENAQPEAEKGGWTHRPAENGSADASGQDAPGTETEKTEQPGKWTGTDGIRVYLEKTEFPADTVSISYTRENRTKNRLRYVSGGSLEQLSDGTWKTRMTETQEVALCTLEEYSKIKETFRLDGLTEPLEEGSYRIRLNGMDIIPPFGSEGAFGENMSEEEILLEFTIGGEEGGRMPAFGTGGTSYAVETDESWIWRSIGQAWEWGKEAGLRVVNLRRMADGLTLLQYETLPDKEKPVAPERPGTRGSGAEGAEGEEAEAGENRPEGTEGEETEAGENRPEGSEGEETETGENRPEGSEEETEAGENKPEGSKEEEAETKGVGPEGAGAEGTGDKFDFNEEEPEEDGYRTEEDPEEKGYRYGIFDRKDGAFYPVPDMVCGVSWDQVITDGTASAWFGRTDGTVVRADLEGGQVVLREYEELPDFVPEINGRTEVLGGKLVLETDPFSYSAGTKKVALWVSNCSMSDIEISGGLFDGLGFWYYDSYVSCVSELWAEEPDFVIRAGERVRTSFSIEGLYEPVKFRKAADIPGRYRLTAGNKRILLTDPESGQEQVEQAAYGVEFLIAEEGTEDSGGKGGRVETGVWKDTGLDHNSRENAGVENVGAGNFHVEDAGREDIGGGAAGEEEKTGVNQ